MNATVNSNLFLVSFPANRVLSVKSPVLLCKCISKFCNTEYLEEGNL